MAELAHALGVRADYMFSSPAVRAISTAKEFARSLGFPLQRIRHDDRIYLAERGVLATILRATPASYRHVLIFGHNPGISRLASWLSGDDSIGELPTAAMCTLKADIDAWPEIAAGVFERVRLRWPDDGGPKR